MVCASCQKAGELQQRARLDPSRAEEARIYHSLCKGGTWCDCRHMPGTMVRPDHKPDPRRGA